MNVWGAKLQRSQKLITNMKLVLAFACFPVNIILFSTCPEYLWRLL